MTVDVGLFLTNIGEYTRNENPFFFILYSGGNRIFPKVVVHMDTKEQADAFEAFLKTVVEK